MALENQMSEGVQNDFVATGRNVQHDGNGGRLDRPARDRGSQQNDAWRSKASAEQYSRDSESDSGEREIRQMEAKLREYKERLARRKKRY